MRGWISLLFVAIAAAAISRPAEGGAMVCGGVGSDERANLAAQTQGANLALEVFATRGEYIADVDVIVAPLDAARPTLRNTADGPICYVHLPAGSYRVEATYNGVTRSTRATLPESPASPVRVALGFPDASSRDERIAPTP